MGTRYTSETASKITDPLDVNRVRLGNSAPAGYSYDQHRTFNSFSWTLGIQDQLTQSLLVYAASRRANKSGGFNPTLRPLAADASVGGDEFNAEKVTDAELGSKFQGRIAGMRARGSVALFYDWINNSQRTALTLLNGVPSSLTVNVPKVEIYGLELESQISPSRWLSLGATFNYINRVLKKPFHLAPRRDSILMVAACRMDQCGDRMSDRGSCFPT